MRKKHQPPKRRAREQRPQPWWWEYPANVARTWDWMNVNLIDGDEMDRLLVEPWDYTNEFLAAGGLRAHPR